MDLFKRVARVRAERGLKPSDNGVKRQSGAYPLNVITYCAL